MNRINHTQKVGHSRRIVAAHQCDGFNKENWPEMITWLVDHRARLETAISDDLKAAARKLRTVAIEE